MNTSKPIRRTDIVAKNVGRETILYGNTDQAIHILNPTARLIWELCDGNHTLADIEQSIRTQFAVPPERSLITDITDTLRVFSDKGLLVSPTTETER